MTVKKLDEYFQATGQRLYNYRILQAMFANAVMDRHEILRFLDSSPSAAIGRYGEKTAKASEPDTQPEAYAIQVEQKVKDLARINRTIDQLSSMLLRLENAIKELAPDEREVISLRHWGIETCKGDPDIEVGDHVRGLQWKDFPRYGYSASNAKKICARAKWKLRNMLFPCRQDEDGTGIIPVE